MKFERDIERIAGQSLNERINFLLDEKVTLYLFFIAALIILIVYTWGIWLLGEVPNPYVLTITSIVFIAVASKRLIELKQEIRLARKGERGERYVGQFLEQLRAIGYRVFHDVVSDDFNIDHVVIGPAGIFLIETKTWSKYQRIENVRYENGLLINGEKVVGDPVQQTKIAAAWLSNLLHKSIGTKYHVSSMVALPDKYIDPKVNHALQATGVLLINPKNIFAFLKAKSVKLTQEQVNQLSLHLSEYRKIHHNKER